MPVALLNKFSEGFKSIAHAIGEEPVTLQNIDVSANTLCTINGAKQMSASGIASSNDVQTLYITEDNNGSYIVLAKVGPYVYIARSATAITDSTYLHFKPLIADAIHYGETNTTVPYYYTKSRPTFGAESIVQFGSDVYSVNGATVSFPTIYLAPDSPSGNFGYGYRFTGYSFSSGTVAMTACNGAYGVVTGTVDFDAGGVEGGDIIYFYNHTSGATSGQWRSTTTNPGYVIAGVSGTTLEVKCGGSGNAQYTTGTGPSGIANVDYSIVRIAPIGINHPGASGEVLNGWVTHIDGCTGSASGNATKYEDWSTPAPTTGDPYPVLGSYGVNGVAYKYRYGDFRTGTWTNLSSSGTFTSGTTGARLGFRSEVSGWHTNPDDKRINCVAIFRAVWDPDTDIVGAYYFVDLITRNQDIAGGAFAATYTDNTKVLPHTPINAAGNAIMTGYDMLHNKPYYNTLRGLDMHGGRLVSTNNAYGNTSKTQLVFSHIASTKKNLNNVEGLEYFNYSPISDETGNVLDAAGGWQPIGSANEIITAFSHEGNSFNETGMTSEAMLVFTNKTLYRFTGNTWSTFNLHTLHGIDGPTGFKQVVNCDGIVFWIGRDGVYGLTNGSSVPVLISAPIFPGGLFRHIKGDLNTILGSWKLQYLGASIAILGSLTSTTPDTAWLYNTKTQAFTTIVPSSGDTGITALNYVNLPGPDANAIVALAAAPANGSPPRFYALYSEGTTAACVYQTLPLALSQEPDDLDKGKVIKEIEVYCHPASGDVVLTCELYGHAASGALYSATGTVTGTTFDNINKIIKFYPDITTVRPSLKLKWTAQKAFSVIYVKITWFPQGDTSILDGVEVT